IPVGTPVVAGTIDAWTEAISVGAHGTGDLMLMYGTTMFLIATGERTLRTPSMWTTVGAFEGTRNLAGGLATSGALTAWRATVCSRPDPPCSYSPPVGAPCALRRCGRPSELSRAHAISPAVSPLQAPSPPGSRP